MTPDLPPNAPETPPPAAIVAPAESEADRIIVDANGFRFVVIGNRILPPDVVVATLQDADTPQKAIEALQRAYQSAGYPLIGLRGDVQGKLVALLVIHGRITEFEAPEGLAPYFSSLEGVEDLDRNAIILKSVLAEAYAARAGMRPKIAFAPAQTFGGTKLTVTEEPLEGAQAWNAGLAFGNLGSRFSSRYLTSANGSWRPGDGLELTANYAYGLPGLTKASSGSLYRQGGGGISVVTPWGQYGATYIGTTYHIGESSAPLFPEGDIAVWGLTGTQLAYADETSRWSFNEAFTRTTNEVHVFQELNFPLTDQLYSFLSAGTSYNKAFSVFGQGANLTLALTGLQGISPRRGTLDPALLGVPNPRFTVVQASVAYTQSLPLGYSASASFSGQWADSPVPQNQQWILGGLGNLTAWLPAVLVGDSGGLGRISVATPSWTWSEATVQAGVFVEGGVAILHVTPATAPVSKGLSDVGFSVSGSLRTGTSVTLAYAHPWGSRNLTPDQLNSLTRGNVYFSLNQSF